MPTVIHIGKLRVIIYPNDHDPAHVHVIGPDGWARIRIGTAMSKPELLESDGLSSRDLAKALKSIDEHHVELHRVWRKHHER